MRNAVLAALALSAAITTQAKADYIWQFVPDEVTAMQSFGGGPDPMPGVSQDEAASWVPNDVRLVVTDAGFAAGSLSLDWSSCILGACQIGPSGNLDRIVAFDGLFWRWQGHPTWGSAHIDLAWTPDGSLSGTVEYYGDVRDFSLGGGASNWTGWIQADDSECGMLAGSCVYNRAHWVFLGNQPGSSVPEPASFALLGVGLLALGAVGSRGELRSS